MSEMICTCSDEGLREAESLRIDVARNLGLKTADLSLGVVASIETDFGAAWAVCSDQWFGVDAGEFYTECDHPLDGFCWAWQQLAKKNPEKVRVMPAPSPEIELVSRTQLDAHKKARAAWGNHKQVGCCETTSAWRLCPEGQALFDAVRQTHRDIDKKWGAPDVATHPKWWGEQETKETP